MESMEQMEFRFEEGELHAPVSHIYKRFIYNLMDYSVSLEGERIVHSFLTRIMKNTISNDSLFKKTPKEFQEEVHQLLESPYEDIYEMIHNRPYQPPEQPADQQEEAPKKPPLRLVK